jgi:hypothetical protein
VPTEAIHKLEPHRTLYLRGFDRRGCAASLNNASASGFTVSGVFSDQADFAVLVLFDADDQFGHLFTTRYLPDFSLTGVTLDFDLAITSAQNPVSRKYQSVPWGAISYITKAESPGTISLQPMATSATGMASASATFTVNGSPVGYDRIELVYLSNVVYDFIVPGNPNPVTFSFYGGHPAGTHTLTIGSSAYSFTEATSGGSSGAAIASGLAAAASANPNCYASASSNSVTLTVRANTGALVTVGASDGNGSAQMWLATNPPQYIAGVMASYINGTNWNSIGPTTALMATVSGASFTVYAARYGTVNTSGTSVSFASGQNYLGSQPGDPIIINGAPYVIASVVSPTSLTLTTSAGTQTGVNYLAPGGGRDGNSIELLEMHKTSTTYLTPAGASKLTGGADPSSVHFHIDFTVNGIDSVRQAWLTFAPALNYDSGSVNPTLVAYQPGTWSAVFTNWTLSDPSSVLPLKIAGPGSVTVGSRDFWASFTGTGWSQQAGFYLGGFARQSANPTDHVTVTYSCQYTHNLYVGTSLTSAGGELTATLDGGAQPTVETYADTGSPIQTRRLIASSVAPGTHVVVLAVSSTHNPLSTGTTCIFDYLQAAVLSDVQSPATTYSNVNCACDFDTAQTYAIAPARAFWILSKAGFAGDIDFYSGVFFALKRVRSGGSFHQATVTISAGSSGFNLGSLFGDGDAIFLTVGGTSFGAAVYPNDTVSTLAQRFINAINTLFIGVCAAPTGTAGQFTVTCLSPVSGFTFSSSYAAGTGAAGANPSTGSITASGDIAAGNEGVWQVDASQTQPLNRAFTDYLTDFCAQVHAAGQTMTVSFSQELLAPPDANTAAGAWAQRFANGNQVLTDTGFGSWGAGFVEAVSGSSPITIQQTGHGYITGNTVHVAGSTQSGVWAITITDANHYQLTTLVSGGYTPSVGDATFIDLQTTQCTFNPSTVTPYLAACYKQAAGVMIAAGLTAWLQFGEVLWWYFSVVQNLAVGYASWTSPISIGTVAPHNLSTGQRAILAGVKGNTAANGDQTIAVTDTTHFTLNGTSGNGNYVGGTGTCSGGGMAYYDAYTAQAAQTALGRSLAAFYTQDDDPTVNGSADTNFLAGLIKSHIDAIRTTVLAAYSGAKFELLWPFDVNFSTCYYTPDVPYPQGGRLNRAVNLPSQYLAQTGSGLDRLKMEALSWGATYRNFTNAQAAIAFPVTTPGSWPVSATAYLVPWFNGGCPWTSEFLQALNQSTPLVCFWAFDHLCLFSWPLPLPKQVGRATFL